MSWGQGEQIVTIAQQQFKDVGVSADLQFEDFASLINRIGLRPGQTEGYLRSRPGHRCRGSANALIPVVTVLGGSLPTLLAGAATTEYVFSWPGMGRLAADAAGSRDYPVVMGLVLIAAVLIIVGNLVSDVLYSVVDPRIRLE